MAGSWFAGGRARSVPDLPAPHLPSRLRQQRPLRPGRPDHPLQRRLGRGAVPNLLDAPGGSRIHGACPCRARTLLSVSSRGELAILLDPKVDYNLYNRRGTLAVVPLSGGSPREVLRDVRWPTGAPTERTSPSSGMPARDSGWSIRPADWRTRARPGFVSPRVSPRGDRIVFYEGLPFNGYSLSVIDSQNRKTVLGPLWSDWWSCPWSPDGDEIWFPASHRRFGVLAHHGVRPLGPAAPAPSAEPSPPISADVSRDGRALITLFDQIEWTRGAPFGSGGGIPSREPNGPADGRPLR